MSTMVMRGRGRGGGQKKEPLPPLTAQDLHLDWALDLHPNSGFKGISGMAQLLDALETLTPTERRWLDLAEHLTAMSSGASLSRAALDRFVEQRRDQKKNGNDNDLVGNQQEEEQKEQEEGDASPTTACADGDVSFNRGSLGHFADEIVAWFQNQISGGGGQIYGKTKLIHLVLLLDNPVLISLFIDKMTMHREMSHYGSAVVDFDVMTALMLIKEKAFKNLEYLMKIAEHRVQEEEANPSPPPANQWSVPTSSYRYSVFDIARCWSLEHVAKELRQVFELEIRAGLDLLKPKYASGKKEEEHHLPSPSVIAVDLETIRDLHTQLVFLKRFDNYMEKAVKVSQRSQLQWNRLPDEEYDSLESEIQKLIAIMEPNTTAEGSSASSGSAGGKSLAEQTLTSILGSLVESLYTTTTTSESKQGESDNRDTSSKSMQQPLLFHTPSNYDELQLDPIPALFKKLTPAIGAKIFKQPYSSTFSPDVLPIIAAHSGGMDKALSFRDLYEPMARAETKMRKFRRSGTIAHSRGAMFKGWSEGMDWNQPQEELPECEKYLTLFRDHARHGTSSSSEDGNGGTPSPLFPRTPGAPITCTRSEFFVNWAALTNNVFEGLNEGDSSFDFTNFCVCGGAVATCLGFLPNQSPALDFKERQALMLSSPYADQITRDIDMFIYGIDSRSPQYHDKVLELTDFLRKKFKGDMLILCTSRNISIVLPRPYPRIQLQLGEAPAIHDLILYADLDSTSIAFDGKDVWFTARSYLSWKHRVNVPSSDLHHIRGSPTYEKRLLKYAKRGFLVLDLTVPLDTLGKDFDTVIADLVATESKKKETSSTKSSTRVSKRKSAKEGVVLLDKSCLRWLLLVDKKLAFPTTDSAATVKDVLKLFDLDESITIADLREKAISAGYNESDNYGQHEEGYMVIVDEENAKDNDALLSAVDDYTVLAYDNFLLNINMPVHLEDGQFKPVKPWHEGLRELTAAETLLKDEVEDDYS